MAITESSKGAIKKLGRQPSGVSRTRPLNPDACLMGIPREVRLEILKYLLPTRHYIPFREDKNRWRYSPEQLQEHLSDNKWQPLWQRADLQKDEDRGAYIDNMHYDYWEAGYFGYKSRAIWKVMRHDFESCELNIARANRVLCEEVHFLMHHGRVFGAQLDCHHLYLKGSSLDTSAERFHEDLLPLLQSVSALYLRIDIWAWAGTLKRISNHDRCRTELARDMERIVTSLRHCRSLRQLIFEVDGMLKIGYTPNGVEMFGESELQEVLDPLRSLSGLNDVRFLFMNYPGGLSQSSVCLEYFIRYSELPDMRWTGLSAARKHLWEGSESFDTWLLQLRNDIC